MYVSSVGTCEHTILPGGKRLEYRGGALDFFGQLLLVSILTTITFGIYAFWGYPRIRRHVISNSFVNGRSLQFTGTGGQYLGIALINLVLTIITFGLYSLLGPAAVRELRWDTENTILPDMPVADAATPVGERPIHVTVNVSQ